MNETVTAAQAMEMLGLSSRTTFRSLATNRGWHSEYRRGFPSLWRRDDIEAEIAARSSRTVHRSQRPPGSGTVAAKAAARERACLRCKQSFPSWGAGNRLCEPCRDYARSVRSSVDD